MTDTTFNSKKESSSDSAPSREEILSRLDEVKEEPKQWLVRAKNWLGRERFKEVSELVKKANGEWVKQGKDSHWIIKK